MLSGDSMSQLPPELIHLVLGYYHIPHVKLITTFNINDFPTCQLHISHVNQNIDISIFHCIQFHSMSVMNVTKKYSIDPYYYNELLKCVNAFQNNQHFILEHQNRYGPDIENNHNTIDIHFCSSKMSFPNTQPIRQQFLHAFQELADTIPKMIDNLNAIH